MKIARTLILIASCVALAPACHAQNGPPPGMMGPPPEGMPPLPPGMKPPAGMPPMDFKMYARIPDKAALAYGTTSPAQKLDIYLPKGSGPFPVVVYIHGGAFKFGDRREGGKGFAADIDALNAKGIAVASIQYRLSGEATYPAAVLDAKRAVRWLRANAANQKLDGRIAVWGKSAGAYLALMVATTGGGSAPGTMEDFGALGGTDDTISGVVAMYPPVEFIKIDEDLRASGCGVEAATHNDAGSPESAFMGAELPAIADKVHQASPLAYLNKSAPPALIMVGTADCVVSPKQGERMVEAYKATLGSDQVTLKILSGAQHADPVFDQGDNLAQVAAFFARIFK